MKKDDFAIRLNESDFLLVDWAYCFPNEGYVGRLFKGGEEIFKTKFFKERNDCVKDAVGRLAGMKSDLENELRWINEATAKMEEAL